MWGLKRIKTIVKNANIDFIIFTLDFAQHPPYSNGVGALKNGGFLNHLCALGYQVFLA
jgi:hypothetical protein